MQLTTMGCGMQILLLYIAICNSDDRKMEGISGTDRLLHLFYFTSECALVNIDRLSTSFAER